MVFYRTHKLSVQPTRGLCCILPALRIWASAAAPFCWSGWQLKTRHRYQPPSLRVEFSSWAKKEKQNATRRHASHTHTDAHLCSYWREMHMPDCRTWLESSFGIGWMDAHGCLDACIDASRPWTRLGAWVMSSLSRPQHTQGVGYSSSPLAIFTTREHAAVTDGRSGASFPWSQPNLTHFFTI